MPLITLPRPSCAVAAHLVGGCLLFASAYGQQAPAPEGAADYRLDPAHTRVHWEVMHFGTSTTRGRFDDVNGSLRRDASGRGSVSIVVGIASVDTGVKPLDAVLRGSYLDAAEFPQAYFVAEGWRWQPDAALDVAGELTLHGVSRPLRLRAGQLRCAPQPPTGREVCGADLQAEFKRSDFGIHDGQPFVGDRVRLVIQVEAVREPPPR